MTDTNADTVAETIEATTNVVYLKDFKKPTTPNNPEVVPDDWNAGYDDYIDNISVSVTFDIAELLEEYGFGIEGIPGIGHDLMMVIESVKSMMFRSQGEYYPLQDIAEDLFEIDDEAALVDGFLNGE